jgi:hypothetical protein
MPRYSHGNPLQRSIVQIVLFESINADGVIQLPGQKASSSPIGTHETGRTPAPVSTTGPKARVKADVNLGLNIRTSEDTSSKANIVDASHAGDVLTIIEPGGWTKIGAINQWVRVRTKNGREGLAAAWYLEKVPGETYPATAESAPGPESQAPSTTSSESTPQKSKLVVRIKKSGLPVYESASSKSRVVSNEMTGAKLAVVEDTGKAIPKIGVAGKWLNVKATNNKRGFVDAGSVKLA